MDPAVLVIPTDRNADVAGAQLFESGPLPDVGLAAVLVKRVKHGGWRSTRARMARADWPELVVITDHHQLGLGLLDLGD